MCSAMGDFHELKLEFRRVWGPVLPPTPTSSALTTTTTGSSSSLTVRTRRPLTNNTLRPTIMPPPPPDGDYHSNNYPDPLHDPDSLVSPGPRFCHVGVVYDGSFYIFGGYDGANRLNDFLRYRFEMTENPIQGPVSTLVSYFFFTLLISPNLS